MEFQALILVPGMVQPTGSVNSEEELNIRKTWKGDWTGLGDQLIMRDESGDFWIELLGHMAAIH